MDLVILQRREGGDQIFREGLLVLMINFTTQHRESCETETGNNNNTDYYSGARPQTRTIIMFEMFETPGTLLVLIITTSSTTLVNPW